MPTVHAMKLPDPEPPPLLQVAAVMPSQMPGSDAPCLPERRLMAAVLEEALYTYFASGGRETPAHRRAYWDAAAWFASDDTAWPFSFLNICAGLGLDAPSIRARIQSDGPLTRRADGADVRRFRRLATGNRNVVGSRALRRMSERTAAAMRPSAVAL